MDIPKTVKTLNLAKKRILLNLVMKRILPKKWQSTSTPWSRIFDEAQERHEVQLNALVDEYQRNGDSENVAHLLKRRTLSFLSTEKNWEKYF